MGNRLPESVLGVQTRICWIILVLAKAATAETLPQCLSAAQVSAIYPQDEEYDRARQVANARIDRFPIAVAYPGTAAQVANIVICAREYNVSVAARGGGHSYEGYSVLDGALVIDMTRNFSTWTRPSALTVEVGAGLQLGPLYWRAWQDSEGLGKLAFPGGSCPDVGLSGFILGGGWGVLSRKYGLACDRLLSLEMVDSNGSVLIANRTTNSDLLWASKGGGGGNFGIVTQFTLSMVPEPPTTVFILLHWPAWQMMRLIELYQSWAPHAPDELTLELQVQASDVTLRGLFLGNKADADALLLSSGFLDVPGISYTFYLEQPYVQSMLFFAWQTQGLDPSDPINLALPPNAATKTHFPFKAKSFDVAQPINSTVLAIIEDAVQSNSRAWVQLSAYGGAINRVPWQSTAFSQRGMLYNMQYYIAWTSSDEQQASMAWINGLYSALAAHIAPNSYVNYVDADLPNWASTYYTGALDRLQAIKAKYDPTNFFRFPQSIPLPD